MPADAQWAVNGAGGQRWLYQRWPAAMVELHTVETADSLSATIHIYDATPSTPPDATSPSSYVWRESKGAQTALILWLANNRDDTVLFNAMTTAFNASEQRRTQILNAAADATAAVLGIIPTANQAAVEAAIVEALRTTV